MRHTLLKVIFSLSVLFGGANHAFSQSTDSKSFPNLGTQWVVTEITDGTIPEEIVTDERERARYGLPDGRVATSNGDIVQAWYSEPTTRYAHGVLGDAIEAGALKVYTSLGATYTYRLPRTEVFEDITPRIADLDGDGTMEVITILSSQRQGASIAIFHLVGNALIKTAQSKFIGRPNRWLNVAGIGRITGARNPEIAIVVTPHLRGILQFYSYTNGALKFLASDGGFSNHEIGSRELRLSALVDIDGNGRNELILPSLRRDELIIIGVPTNQFAVMDRIQLPARVDKAIGTRRVSGKFEIILGLDNNKIYSVGLQ